MDARFSIAGRLAQNQHLTNRGHLCDQVATRWRVSEKLAETVRCHRGRLARLDLLALFVLGMGLLELCRQRPNPKDLHRRIPGVEHIPCITGKREPLP